MESAAITASDGQQLLLNLILGAMIFGLALDLHPRDFVRVFQKPKAPLIGIVAQFFLLPAATFILTLMVDLDPAIELGMILVACCPGGAISNFMTMLAKGNVALSLSMTGLSSLLAIVMLPINFAFWSSLNPDTAQYLQDIHVDASRIFAMLMIVLAVPLILGMMVHITMPKIAKFLYKILKPASVLMLFVFIIVAVAQNLDQFLTQFWLLFAVVAVHNGLAFSLGYMAARFGRLNGPDRRAVSIEVGLQNSSLAIVIIFTQINADPNMLLIAAFWGSWHIVSGLSVAVLCHRYANDVPVGEAGN